MTGKRGFSMLEVLIACVVLSAGTVAIVNACTKVMATIGNVERVVSATSIAEAKMEQIRQMAFSAITNGDPAFAASADANFPDFTVDASTSGTDPKRIDVVVSWSVAGGQSSLTVTTLRTSS